jgi:sugar phosphate isomerase/epimerase
MSESMPIGVCSWSIDRTEPLGAIATAGRELRLPLVQVGFFDESTWQHLAAAEFTQAAATAGTKICATFAKFPREDGSSIATIQASGGFLDDAEAEARLSIVQRVGELTAAMGATHLAIHAGTIPRDPGNPAYDRMRERVAAAAEALAPLGVRLLLETGCEPAVVLAEFIEKLAEPNVGVNYDGANFILYGSDDPIRAFAALKAFVEIVHLKDAVPSEAPGETFGKVVPLGTGEAQIPRLINKLRASGYAGPLLIENPATAGGVEGIPAAADYVRSMLA